MKGRTIKKLVSIVVTAVLFVLLVVFDLFTGFEYRVQDSVFQEPGLRHPDILIFGIDEEALYRFGPWPWPRHVMADAIDILNTYDDYRPAVIGIDVMFTEEARFFQEYDDALAEAAARAGNVVLASSVLIGIDHDTLSLEPVILRHLTPFPALLPYVEHGLINGIIDPDGTVRNALLWEPHQGEILYSFPVVISMMYQGVDEPAPFIQENPEMFIRYTGVPGVGGFKGDFFEHSFAEIFEPDFDPGWYFDQIILIGPYAIGMMDHYPVPIMRDAPMYGVEIHANVIQAILDEAFKLRAPAVVGGLIVTVMLLLGMALGEFTDIRIMLVSFIALATGYYFGAQFVFTNHYYVLPLLVPPLTLGIVAVYQLIYGYALNAYEKSKIRNTFMKYVDPKLVNSLMESGEADSNAVGNKKHIAVVFVDVRGFTPMTESLRDTPEMVVETLNEYLELTSTAVFNNGGSVDKFIGDATMALFNGFVPLDDYIYKAVKSAWDMVQGAASVNELIKSRYGVDIGFGVGIHCGEAIVGNLGPSFRKDYTAIGDTVNTAARLESNAQRSQVLISRDVYDLLQGRIQVESIGEIPLKGKSVPLEVFALTGVN